MIKPIPTYTEWATFGTFGVAGKTGTGKSSTMRLILSQLAMDNCGIIVADGHGKLQGSLAQSITALSNAFIVPPIVEFPDILKSINAIESILDDRISGKDKSESKIVLVIDEFTSFFRHMNKDQIKTITKILLAVGNEARKTNIRVILAAHNWTQDYIGAAVVRRSIGAMLFHRLDEGESKLFIESNSKLRQQIANLKKGEAILNLPTIDPCKVILPYITMDDLEEISQYVTNAQMFRDQYGYKFSETVKETPVHTPVRATRTVEDLVDEIIELRLSGLSKTKIIWKMFQAHPGSSPKYKAASKLYDNIMKKIDERAI